MSESDWDFLAKDNSPAKVKPKKDMVATDGQKLTLGDTTVTLYSTPGPRGQPVGHLSRQGWEPTACRRHDRRHD